MHEFASCFCPYQLYPYDTLCAHGVKQLEIVESRYKRDPTIFCSQFDIPGWPEKLSDQLLADAICDRIDHDAYLHRGHWRQGIHAQAKGAARHLTPTIFIACLRFLYSTFQHGFRFQNCCTERFLRFAFGGKDREQKIQCCVNPCQIVCC